MSEHMTNHQRQAHTDTTRFIHIRSGKFPVLPGEDAELVNEGTYGKSLAQYLEARLKERAYEIPFHCCEDWGWWVAVEGQSFGLGVCVYGASDLPRSHELCVRISESPRRRWSWARFGFIDTAPRVTALFNDLADIFASDKEVQILGYPQAYPLD